MHRSRAFVYLRLSGRSPQGDMADLILKCAAEDEWVRRAPIPGY
ncbi:MAG: hypothetical protein AAGC55_01490 [Myxococcota bacterium]